ncbi:MAG: gamma-glutamyltransferase [Saprospiraceae bacterium]
MNTSCKERMADFSPDSGTSAILQAGAFQNMKESFETTHTSIVDAQGNAVSLTTTLIQFWLQSHGGRCRLFPQQRNGRL